MFAQKYPLFCRQTSSVNFLTFLDSLCKILIDFGGFCSQPTDSISEFHLKRGRLWRKFTLIGRCGTACTWVWPPPRVTFLWCIPWIASFQKSHKYTFRAGYDVQKLFVKTFELLGLFFERTLFLELDSFNKLGTELTWYLISYLVFGGRPRYQYDAFYARSFWHALRYCI